eukprot:s2857_g4.t1
MGSGRLEMEIPEIRQPLPTAGENYQAVATGKQLVFLEVQKTTLMRHWKPLPAGPARPSEPWCLAVAEAPFFEALATGRQLVVLEVQNRCPQVRSVLQGHRAWLWRKRRFVGLWRLGDSQFS